MSSSQPAFATAVKHTQIKQTLKLKCYLKKNSSIPLKGAHMCVCVCDIRGKSIATTSACYVFSVSNVIFLLTHFFLGLSRKKRNRFLSRLGPSPGVCGNPYGHTSSTHCGTESCVCLSQGRKVEWRAETSAVAFPTGLMK